MDGNKRIAWTSSMRVLTNHGLTVDVSQEEAEVFCQRIANSQSEDSVQSGAEAVRWIGERLRIIE